MEELIQIKIEFYIQFVVPENLYPPDHAIHDHLFCLEGGVVIEVSPGDQFFILICKLILVSLSLSIGMSTVAQKTGVQIEALFIDEGFGTLDDSSIHDAMDILESVRRSSGMIGIISHVQLLENNIPTHLEVIKANGGSTIVPV